MTGDIQGTQTETNLMKAFAGEAMARNRYTFYSKVAVKEGFEQIGAIFLETADNERMHAKRFFTFFGKDNIPIEISDISYPTGLADTLTNLEYAIEGEHEENSHMYPEYARIAREEGFEVIANCYEAIIQAEIAHEQRYRALYEDVKNNMVFKKPDVVLWKCRKCGYPYEGMEAPHVCPACLHPRAFFEIYAKNY